MIKAGIIGATGYAGNEIVRLLLGHKDVEIKWFGSRSYIDQQYADIYQNFFRLVDAKCMDDNMAALADEVDVIFTATPQGLCASLINEEILSKCKVIDLSADFRIKDVKKYEKWYGIPLIVHRLDMATSGLLLAAKTKEVHNQLKHLPLNLQK